MPKDCGGSSFCRVTKRILGPDVLFRIVAHMPELGSIDITAGFRDIRLTESVSFSKLELVINVCICIGPVSQLNSIRGKRCDSLCSKKTSTKLFHALLRAMHAFEILIHMISRQVMFMGVFQKH